MPELTGLDVLRELRRFNLSIPFILMSGHAVGTDAEIALQMGATAFLSKPFSPGELEEVLSKL